MNKTLFIAFLVGLNIAFTGLAQTEPYILPDVIAQKMSSDGKALIAQDYSGNAIVFHTETQYAEFYPEYYPGNGNCYSSNGILVGQSMYGFGAVMKNNRAVIPPSIENYAISAFNGITSDGSRACGWIANTGRGVLDVPFYCDIDEEGNVSDPVILPYPTKDLMGGTPQFCTAVWISDDGKTIIGQVMDSTGFSSYPIVYKENDGEWSYSLPSESLFNPDNLPFPERPRANFSQPNITDYMTPEKAKEWTADYNAWMDSNDPEMNPWDILDYYITPEAYAEYLDAMAEYNEKLLAYYAELDEYWEQMNRITNGAVFALGVMAMNPQGTIMSTSGVISEDEGLTDVASGYITYLFNLEDGTFKKINSTHTDLIPVQILPDNTLIAINPAYYTAFLLFPDADEFITFEDYISSNSPEYLPWMKDNLSMTIYTPGQGTEEYLQSGILCCNHDMSVIAGGVIASDIYTYIFGLEKASVEMIEETIPGDGTLTVYNLQGVKMNVKEVSELSSGLYIINGKKVVIK